GGRRDRRHQPLPFAGGARGRSGVGQRARRATAVAPPRSRAGAVGERVRGVPRARETGRGPRGGRPQPDRRRSAVRGGGYARRPPLRPVRQAALPLITSAANERLQLDRKPDGGRGGDKLGLFVGGGEPLVAAGRAGDVEPVDVLVAGEDVEPELLASVSGLPHPPRVVAVYRRADLPGNTSMLGI